MKRHGFAGAGAMALTLLVSCTPLPRRIPSAEVPHEAVAVSAEASAVKLLRDVARSATGSGARELIVLGYGAATPGDRIEALVHVPQRACVLLYARATDSVEDLDLHIFGDDGSQFGLDESPDALPTLLLCPETETRLFASARVAQGAGLVALGVQTVAEVDAHKIARAVGARNFAQEAAPLEEPWPGLNAAIEDRRASLGGEWTDLRRVALPLDSRVPTHLTVEVPSKRCLDVLVLPDSDTSGQQLQAVDEEGRIFARGDSIGKRQALLLCAKLAEKSVTLEVRPFAGRGVGVAAISVSAGPLTTLDLGPEVSASLVDESEIPADRAELLPPSMVKRLKLNRGQIVSWETQLKDCTRLELLPDRQLLDVRATVWNAEGELLGETVGHRGAPLFICPNGAVRIDLEARERSGELTIEFRTSDSSSAVLSENPLAASRLISRAYQAGYLKGAEEVGRVTPLQLSATKLGRVPITVPALHCQTIFIGVGHGAFGVEARVVDSANGLDVDRGVGRTSLQLRACAPRGGSLNAQMEVRATSGSTRALWSARQERLPVSSE